MLKQLGIENGSAIISWISLECLALSIQPGRMCLDHVLPIRGFSNSTFCTSHIEMQALNTVLKVTFSSGAVAKPSEPWQCRPNGSNSPDLRQRFRSISMSTDVT